MRPDATSSTSASATCTTTSRLRARCRSRLWLDVRVAPRRAVTSRGPLYFKTGMNPNSNPDRSEAISVNARTIGSIAISRSRGSVSGPIASSELRALHMRHRDRVRHHQPKQQTLLQQFTCNAPPSRTERRSRRELLLTSLHSHEQKIGDVRARQSATQRRSFP